VKSPGDYDSTFLPYASVTDILITGHFWDPRSPVFFTREDMKKPEFRISIIADVSCDINGAIPSTLRATTISDPFYAYNPYMETEEPAFSHLTNVTVMSIDNLPGELPRDASLDFGKQLMGSVLDDLLSETESPMITRATILKEGKLTPRYNYLNDYLNAV
jgi:alanine dehydrogenase